MMRGMMIRDKSLRYALLLALGVFLATSGHAQQSQPAPPAAKPAKAPRRRHLRPWSSLCSSPRRWRS